jgi:hypothetical protein
MTAYASSGSRTCDPARQSSAEQPAMRFAGCTQPFCRQSEKKELFILIFIPILNFILILILMNKILKR